MIKLLSLITYCFVSYNVNAQTLQQVTENGNVTNKPIILEGSLSSHIYRISDGTNILFNGLERAGYGGNSMDGLAFVYGENAYHIATNSLKRLSVLGNGNVGIGTIVPREKLSVNGKIRAQEIKVEVTDWPDYVFKQEYQKMSLSQIDTFIKANGHLPEVPSAQKVEKEGVSLGEMNKILLKKIEELTLHLIEKDKQVEDLKVKMEAIASSVEKLKTEKSKN